MNFSARTKRSVAKRGLGRIELVALIGAIVMVGFVLWAVSMAKAKMSAGKHQCISNLKQIGLAYQVFANDHGGRFPWQTSSNAAYQDESPGVDTLSRVG